MSYSYCFCIPTGCAIDTINRQIRNLSLFSKEQEEEKEKKGGGGGRTKLGLFQKLMIQKIIQTRYYLMPNHIKKHGDVIECLSYHITIISHNVLLQRGAPSDAK